MFSRIFITLLVVFSANAALAETHWNQFRGPTGRGHSVATGVIQKWDASNVLWKTSLKGTGQSSAVNWGDRIFITSASDDGTERYVYGISAADGKIVWEETIKSENPEEIHAMNSRATPSCATDGEHVVAFFGPAGIHCFDLDGKKQWSVDLGIFAGSWGIAGSPVIYNGTVIQNCDSMGVSKLVALSLKDGSIVWETPREDKPRGGWSTPILIDVNGKNELALNGEFGMRGYDPDSGEELWFCKGFNGRGAPVPDYADGKLYVVNGKPGDTYCVKPGGKGDVTESHMLWHASRKGGRDLPSPAVVDGHLFITSMSAIASCYDAETGDVHYVERLEDKIEGAKGIEIAAGPLVADGLIYLQTVNGGDVIVVRPGKELKVVSVNSLGDQAKGEIFRATVAPIGGKLFLRSGGALYCVGG